MNKKIILLRGVSGSGKSSFCDLIAEPKVVCSADHYFENEDGYWFNPLLLGKAHSACQLKFEQACQNPEIKNIIVDNTNTKPSDFQYYLDRAEAYDIPVVSVVLEKRHNNSSIHNVPDHVLERQHQNLISNLKLR